MLIILKTMKPYKVSILDQSPLLDGQGMKHALESTMQLVKVCEELGYYRYWFSEQHAMKGFAGCAPEILMAYAAAQTQSIRLGSGSILLNHYSPYKVAESMAVLSALSPERLDIGLGRDLGPNESCIKELAFPHLPSGKDEFYEEKVKKLLDYLGHNLNEQALPPIDQSICVPEFWISGTKDTSAALAAKYGLGYVHGIFPGSSYRNPKIIQNYKENFKATQFGQKPQVILAFDVLCAQTREQAKTMVYSDAMLTVELANSPGQLSFTLSDPDTIDPNGLSEQEKEVFDKVLSRTIYGTVQECKGKIDELVKAYQADEVMILSNCYRFEDRLNSFQLLAEITTTHRNSS